MTTSANHKALVFLEAKNDMSTLEVNCGSEGSLGVQSLEEKVNIIIDKLGYS